MPRVAIENTLMYDINRVDAANTPAGLMDITSYISGYVDGEGCFENTLMYDITSVDAANTPAA